MERKFCGKCGKPISECTCGKSDRYASTGFGSFKSSMDTSDARGSYYIERFDNIALIQDEVVVKEYHIGEFSKSFGIAGSGSASIIVTNKRVISKQDSTYFGSSSTSVEELALESVAGVQNYFFKGYTIWKIIIACPLLLYAFIGVIGMLGSAGSHQWGMVGSSFLITLISLLLGVFLVYKSRKPSYLFSIYASTTSQAMTTGVNLRGKLFNSQGNGLVFQYKPTEDAITMMLEIGACIMDLKAKGDYAIEAWRSE